MNRRNALRGLALGGCALAMPGRTSWAEVARGTAALAVLERQYGGRLGVSILDTGSAAHLDLHGDQRFVMCSTFKLLADIGRIAASL